MTRKELLTDRVVKEKENLKRNMRRTKWRTDSIVKEKENRQRNVTRKEWRTDSIVKEKENQKRNSTRQILRCDDRFRQIENTHWQKTHSRTVTLENQVHLYNDLLRRGDTSVCTSCQQSFYQHSIYTVGR
ncbi:hypothetical protein DPMN_015729 [Dreissena polymorpha]|uniref:Uncharacterized protein n=1 Tax=Dreissena polymorpha TaxID=45954 RepID=A0A9D4NC02_DREPO|nr:hypothetical protein DPMN_015729 [Dreissena polymorpha]